MKKIPRNAKVLSVSHNDLDGVGCQILLGGVFKNIEYMNCSYYSIDKDLLAINGDDYDVVFVTDISPKVSEVLDGFNNLILIDHHQTAENVPEKRRFVNKKYSATYLTKHFLEKMYGEGKLSRYTKLVKLINDYDLWELKYKGSTAMNDLFSMYNAEKFRERFRHGDITLRPNEKSYLKSVKEKFDRMYDELEVMEFEEANVCFFVSDIFVNEFSHRLMKEEGYDFVMFNTLKNYKISIRSSMEDFNFGLYLKDLGIGGGHKQSAGVDVASEEEMNKTVDFLVKDLCERIPTIRK